MRADLETELGACEDFLSLLKERAWAEQAYLLFPNREWISERGRFSLSWRAAGGFIADARGDGETYLDYYIPYCWGTIVEDHAMQERLEGLLAALGWREVGPDDRARFFLDGLRVLVLAEDRPAGPVPEWYRSVAERSPEPDELPTRLIDRVHLLARRGQVSQEEFGSLVNAFLVSDDEMEAVVAKVEAARDAGEVLPQVLLPLYTGQIATVRVSP